MSSSVEFLSFNGQIVPYADARVHMLSPGLKYGAGLFEGVRAYKGTQDDNLYLFQLDEHLDRLEFSKKVMRFHGGPSKDEIASATKDLIRKNRFQSDLHIRIMHWIDGDADLTATSPVGWGIAALPRGINARVKTGVRTTVASWRRLSDDVMAPRVKATANYNTARLPAIQAANEGYDNVIILTREGHVAEAPLACFFMVRNGRPITPSVTSGILESLTRAALISLFKEKFGLDVEERNIDRTELYAAEEAFFCGSGAEIQPVISVDGLPVGTGEPGALTRALQEAYFSAVRDPAAGWSHWLTPAYA